MHCVRVRAHTHLLGRQPETTGCAWCTSTALAVVSTDRYTCTHGHDAQHHARTRAKTNRKARQCIHDIAIQPFCYDQTQPPTHRHRHASLDDQGEPCQPLTHPGVLCQTPRDRPRDCGKRNRTRSVLGYRIRNIIGIAHVLHGRLLACAR